MRSRFLRRCINLPWKASSPTRSMAVTATRSRGGWWDILACRRPTRPRRSNIAARRLSSSPNPLPTFPNGDSPMAKTMKAVDAVMVGMGWSGSIMARELTKAGLTVVGLERGAEKSPREDFALPRIRDELKYRVRQELMLDTAIETHTLRNNPSELALPMRKWDVPPVGDGLGGAGAHWNGVTWRFLPSEFVLRTHLTERYGRNAVPDDMTIQDSSPMTTSSPTMIILNDCAALPVRQA